MDHPQALEQCPYCVSKVKANRMSIHIGRCHANVRGKQQCLLHTDHRVDNMNLHLDHCTSMDELKKNAYDSGGICTVPEPPRCVIDYGNDVESWDNSKFPLYDPLKNTQEKNIIRGSYASGLKPAERKNVIEEERARRAELIERENAERINKINCNRPNTTLNNRSIVGYRLPPQMSNFAERDSDSNVSSLNTLPLHNSTSINRSLNEITNNDPTTDSDGFTAVKSNRRNNPTKSVTRGRGRGRCNQK